MRSTPRAPSRRSWRRRRRASPARPAIASALIVAACIALATVVVGLVRVLLGPTRADRVMAVQLLGTGGIAVLVLLAAATAEAAILDAALVLAVLAAFAAAAFVHAAARR